MNYAAFIIILFLIQFVCVYVGKKTSSDLNTQDDYFLASKNVGFFPLLMTLIATQVGGGLVLGAAEEAYKYGWIVILYPMGAALGLFLLSLGFGRKMAELNVSTVAEIFEKVYQSKLIRKIASIFSIVSLFLIFMAQIVASSKFMLSIGVDNKLIFFSFWGIVIFYTVRGGLKAVISTDIVQAFFFVATFLACTAYVYFFSDVTILNNIAENQTSEAFNFDSTKFSAWLLMPMLFMLIEQDMGQRFFAAKSGKIVSYATVVASVCIFFISLIPIYFGILARSIGLESVAGSSVLIDVIQKATNPVLSAFVCSAIIVAIVSTADSLLNAISSNISQDFVGKISIRSSQVITAIIAVCGMLLSLGLENIVDLLIFSYELSIVCLFVPLVYGFYKKTGSQQACFGAILGGAVGLIAFRTYPVDFPKEILALGISLAGFVLGQLIAQREVNSFVVQQDVQD